MQYTYIVESEQHNEPHPPTNTTHLAAQRSTLLPSYNNHNHWPQICHQIIALSNFHNSIAISAAILSEIFLGLPQLLINNCSHWSNDYFLPRPYQFTIHYTFGATKSKSLTAVLTHILADKQSEHVLKLRHFTRSHVERNLRLRSTSGLLYAWDIHPHHYSPQIAPWQRGTLTRNVMPTSHPIPNIQPFKPRIKSHLLFAGIISSPFSPR